MGTLDVRRQGVGNIRCRSTSNDAVLDVWLKLAAAAKASRQAWRLNHRPTFVVKQQGACRCDGATRWTMWTSR